MAYIVMQILEPDYGCEDRPDDYIKKDTVQLQGVNGERIVIYVADQELYDKDINEGNLVDVDDNGVICKETT